MRSFQRDLICGILLLLLGLWLPACAELPGLPPPGRSIDAATADEPLFQNAEASYRQQRYTDAWRLYHSYLERFPQGRHVTAARLREGELLGLQGNWQGSLMAYQSILSREPREDTALPARYGVGRAYFKLGQYQQALQVLENLTAVDLPPALRFSTQALLTEIALKQSRPPQAFARLRLAAQDLAAGDKEWFEDLQTRVVEQATPQELENMATLYRDSPASAVVLLRLATLAQRAGRADEAQKWTGTLKERFPESPEAAKVGALLSGQRRLVGCLVPLSGEFGNLGRHVKQGMELAARGSSLEMSFRDTPNDPGSAAQMVRDLAKDPRLLAILGPIRSGAVQGAAAAAQEAQVTLISMAQKGGVTQAGDFVFQAFLTARQQVRALFRRTMGQAGLKRYAVLYPDAAFGQTFLQQFLEEAEVRGAEVADQVPYAPNTRDFAPALSTLKAIYQPEQGSPGFDALFIPDDAPTVAAIAGQLAALGLKNLQLLGTNLLHAPNLTDAEARALEGILFPDAFFARDPAPAVQVFMAAYRQQYGDNPDYLAAQGYVVVKLLLKALEADRGLKRAELPRRLLALKEFPDLPWFKGFNGDREAELSLYLLTIKNGAVQLAP